MLSAALALPLAVTPAAALFQEAAGPTADVVFRFEAADGTPLEAKLSLPPGREGPVPVVFYLHGAGVRSYDNPFGYEEDGEVKIGKYLDFHAERLARRGIGFCRMSKRGCQAAEPPRWLALDRPLFSTATPSVLLADYEACLAELRERPEIDAERVVLLGSSEGTRLAPRLARVSPDGIIGVVMTGYAEDNTKDTVVWQTSVGPWRNVQHMLPSARDGAVTRAEYDEAAAEDATLTQLLPFEALDVDADGSLTAEDLRRVNAPRLELILAAVEEGDDEFLWDNVVNLTAAYLREEWDGEPNHARLLELDIPLAIFHGDLDGTCRVEGVHETQAAFREAKKTNLTVRLYPTGNHDLDWTWQAARDGEPPAYRDVFDYIAELVEAGATRR